MLQVWFKLKQRPFFQNLNPAESVQVIRTLLVFSLMLNRINITLDAAPFSINGVFLYVLVKSVCVRERKRESKI